MGESILSDGLNALSNEAKGNQVKIPEQRCHARMATNTREKKGSEKGINSL